MVGVAVVEPILLHFWFATLWRQEPRQEVLKLDSPEQKLQVRRDIPFAPAAAAAFAAVTRRVLADHATCCQHDWRCKGLPELMDCR